jgi:hypothetical protein
MIKKSTWIMLVIFLVAVGFTYYFQNSPTPVVNPTPLPTLLPKLVSGWVSSDIIQIDVQKSDNKFFSIQRDSTGQWELANLDTRPLDQGKVEELISTIMATTVQTSLKQGQEMDMLGLMNPAIIIKMKNTKGEGLNINVGNATPTDSGYYVQINQDLPVVIGKTNADDFSRLLNIDSLIGNTKTLTPNS